MSISSGVQNDKYIAEHNFVYWLFSCIHSRLDTLHDFFGDRPVDHITYHILQMKEPSPSQPAKIKNKYEQIRKKSLPLIKSRFELFKDDVLKAMNSITIPNQDTYAVLLEKPFTKISSETYFKAIIQLFSKIDGKFPPRCLNKDQLMLILMNYLTHLQIVKKEIDSILIDMGKMLDGTDNPIVSGNLHSYTKHIQDSHTQKLIKDYGKRFEPAIVLFYETVMNRLMSLVASKGGETSAVLKHQLSHIFSFSNNTDGDSSISRVENTSVLTIGEYNIDVVKQFFESNDIYYHIDTTNISEMKHTQNSKCTIASDWDAATKTCTRYTLESGKEPDLIHTNDNFEFGLVSQAFDYLDLKIDESGNGLIDFQAKGKQVQKKLIEVNTSVGSLSKCVFDANDTSCSPFKSQKSQRDSVVNIPKKEEHKYYLDFKRSGDAYQVLMVNELNKEESDSNKKHVFVTFDHLAFLKARMVGIPCIFSFKKSSLIQSDNIVAMFKPPSTPRSIFEENQYLNKKYIALKNKFSNISSLPNLNEYFTQYIQELQSISLLDVNNRNNVLSIINACNIPLPPLTNNDGPFKYLFDRITSIVSIENSTPLDRFARIIQNVNNAIFSDTEKNGLISSYIKGIQNYMASHMVSAAIIDFLVTLVTYAEYLTSYGDNITDISNQIISFDSVVSMYNTDPNDIPKQSELQAKYISIIDTLGTFTSLTDEQLLQSFMKIQHSSTNLYDNFLSEYISFANTLVREKMERHMDEFERMMGAIKSNASRSRIESLINNIKGIIDKFIKSTLIHTMKKDIEHFIKGKIESNYDMITNEEVGELINDMYREFISTSRSGGDPNGSDDDIDDEEMENSMGKVPTKYNYVYDLKAFKYLMKTDIIVSDSVQYISVKKAFKRYPDEYDNICELLKNIELYQVQNPNPFTYLCLTACLNDNIRINNNPSLSHIMISKLDDIEKSIPRHVLRNITSDEEKETIETDIFLAALNMTIDFHLATRKDVLQFTMSSMYNEDISSYGDSLRSFTTMKQKVIKLGKKSVKIRRKPKQYTIDQLASFVIQENFHAFLNINTKILNIYVTKETKSINKTIQATTESTVTIIPTETSQASYSLPYKKIKLDDASLEQSIRESSNEVKSIVQKIKSSTKLSDIRKGKNNNSLRLIFANLDIKTTYKVLTHFGKLERKALLRNAVPKNNIPEIQRLMQLQVIPTAKAAGGGGSDTKIANFTMADYYKRYFPLYHDLYYKHKRSSK